MEIKFFRDIRSFAQKAEPLAYRNALGNNLFLEDLHQGIEMGSEKYLMANAEENGTVWLAALYRPPFRLSVCALDNNGLWRLAAERMGAALAEQTEEISSVLGIGGLPRELAESYAAALGKQAKLGRAMTVMTLDRVPIQPDRLGHLRMAREEDLYFLPHWRTAYRRDCGLPVETLRAAELTAREQIHKGRLFLWEADTPKAMAAVSRIQETGVFLSGVYTPPVLRGEGWGTACVSALCRHLLRKGYPACCLYVDNANPVSNQLYRKVGFIPECGSEEYLIQDRKTE